MSKEKSLQELIAEEFERRKSINTNFGNAMKGFDDFCRKTTARFLYENPRAASNWIKGRVLSLTKALDDANREEDFLDILSDIHQRTPFSKATSECPRYAIIPPTLKPPSEWHKMIKPAFTTKENLIELLVNGFMPIKSKEVGYQFHGPLLDKYEYVLVDCDYGIAILPPGLQRRNVSVDDKMLERYVEFNKGIISNPSEIFDIGAIRGNQLLFGSIPSNFSVPSIEVTTKIQLHNIIQHLREAMPAKSNLELWFRGQSSEYLLRDMSKLATIRDCPWRSVQDISQVPSLYRDFNDKISKLSMYCEQHIELLKYYYFFKECLGIPSFNVRDISDESIELFNKKWGEVVPELTSTMYINEEPIECHDTHNAYRSLQAALFMQHYGLTSNVIDITSDIDVALFFAQNKVVDNRYVEVDFRHDKPVIYLFFMDKELDPFMDTTILLENHGLLRPKRQQCGILTGASAVSRNYYGRFISIKLIITKKIEMVNHDQHYYFPGPSEDEFLGKLNEFAEDQNFKYIKPFNLIV